MNTPIGKARASAPPDSQPRPPPRPDFRCPPCHDVAQDGVQGDAEAACLGPQGFKVIGFVS